MKRSTQLSELKTQVKHNTLHKEAALGASWRKMVMNRTKKSLCITWVKTTHTRVYRTMVSYHLEQKFCGHRRGVTGAHLRLVRVELLLQGGGVSFGHAVRLRAS